jgi:hypothetical protein
MTGAEIIAIAGAVSGIMKLATAIIEAIERGESDLSDEAKEAIRRAHTDAQAAIERLSIIPVRGERDDDDD